MSYKELDEEGGEVSRYTHESSQYVQTPHGKVLVSVEPGCDIEKQKNKPIWLTYHDIGTNHHTCFGSFFALKECAVFKELFCVVHIDAPGHEVGAEPLTGPSLTLDQLAEQVSYVVKHFHWDEGYAKIYGFGVGAGCSVLLKYATFDVNQGRFAGMILVNGSGSKPGWREWMWNKMLTMSLRAHGMNTRTTSALLHRMFTNEAIEDNEDLVEEYTQELAKMDAGNVARFVDAYAHRTDISDEVDAISCFDVIQFAGGDNSDFYWHVKELNKMFDLGKSTFMRIDECSMLVTEEGPHHIANPIKYWLAGKGYVLSTLDVQPNRHPDDD